MCLERLLVMLSYMCRAYPEPRYSTSAEGRQDPGCCQSLPKPGFSVNPFGAGLSWLKAGAQDTAGICRVRGSDANPSQGWSRDHMQQSPRPQNNRMEMGLCIC